MTFEYFISSAFMVWPSEHCGLCGLPVKDGQHGIEQPNGELICRVSMFVTYPKKLAVIESIT